MLFWTALPCAREESCRAQGAAVDDGCFGAAHMAIMSLVAGPLRWLGLCTGAMDGDGSTFLLTLTPRGASVLTGGPWPAVAPTP